MSFYTKRKLKNNNLNQLEILGRLPGILVIGLITAYQWTLSPDHGILSLYTVGVCKYRPTCSEHTKQAVKKYGTIQGLKKGWEQIKHCH